MKPVVPALISLALSATTVSAYCIDPTEPYCIRAFGTFDSEFSFDSCRGELERYQDDTETFVRCKADELETARREAEEAQSQIEESQRTIEESVSTMQDAQKESRDAVQAFNEAIEYWNCKAGGGSIC